MSRIRSGFPHQGSPNELLTRSRGQYDPVNGITLPCTSPNDVQQARYAHRRDPHSEFLRDHLDLTSEVCGMRWEVLVTRPW